MFEQALSGVKVIDLTQYIAGPYCTKQLADFGAEVIKVEKPGRGDGGRRLGPFLGGKPHPEKSGLFAYLNGNKRGITLNLKSDTGRSIFLRLIAGADILVESYAPGVMPSFGLTYERLKEINPRLVMVSISNFGQSGPYRDFKASELVLNAMGGETYPRGLSLREPLKLGGNAVQCQGGTIAAVSASVALWDAEQSGEGDHIDVSIFETQITSIDQRGPSLVGYQYSKRVATRRAPGTSRGYPMDAYMCSDGYVQIAAEVHMWDRVLKMLDYPEELSDRAMGTSAGQADEDLKGIFEAYFIPWCVEKTKQDVFLKCQAANVFAGPINTMEDVAGDPQFGAREFFIDVEHPIMGEVRMPGPTFRLGETPWELKRPAPLLGQHNEEVLGGLGYTKEDLVRLAEAGII